MSKAPVRTAQLIAPFGPGALYANRDGHMLIVAGLDHWFQRRNTVGERENAEDRSEFAIHEPRLSRLLGGTMFFRAPDYRAPRKGVAPPPNARLAVPALRFPTWYRNQKDNHLMQVGAGRRGRIGVGRERWVPVRFATACEHGHLSEFPWKDWAQCTCTGSDGLHLDDRGGTGLDSIRVYCTSCPEGTPGRQGRNLQGLTRLPEVETEASELGKAGFTCRGDKPWLGSISEPCGSNRLVAALLSQSNLYSSRSASSLQLPDPELLDGGVAKIIDFIRHPEQAKFLGKATIRWQTGLREQAIQTLLALLDAKDIEASDENARRALSHCCEGSKGNLGTGDQSSDPESIEVAFRREEYSVLRRPTPVGQKDVCLRVVESGVPSSLEPFIAQLNRIEELTEVRALCGFSRLKEVFAPLGGVAEEANRQLFRKPLPIEQRWLPATRVRGEGIFIRLREDAFEKWKQDNSSWLRSRLSDNFVARLASQHRVMAPMQRADRDWAARFLLAHTFSHLLINQLVFESGYSTAALRERLYVSPDSTAPMVAILIYTAQGDSEGTLGGLVNLGHKDRFEQVVRRALSRASWCSADPVCSESRGAGAKLVNLAACHACALLPETACETINDGLDRSMVVGTPTNRQAGFLSALVSAPSLAALWSADELALRQP